MYWNNPTIRITYPLNSQPDPIAQSFHNGAHCIFYNPAVPKETIRYQQSLQDICDWANGHIEKSGIDGFINNPGNHYDIANIVKLNMWIDDIRKQGIIKPMNIFYDGQEQYGINNGESRLRAVNVLPASLVCQHSYVLGRNMLIVSLTWNRYEILNILLFYARPLTMGESKYFCFN
jgi:hypothetical protein